MGGAVARQGVGAALLTLVLLLSIFWSRHLCVPLPVEVQGTGALVGGLLDRFAASHRVWGEVAAALLVVINATLMARLVIRYMIVGSRTFIPMVVYGAVACGVFMPHPPLSACVCAWLVVEASSLLASSFRRDYSFDRIFRSSILLGIVPYVYAPGCVLLLLIPAAMVLYKRSLREWIVALCGVAFSSAAVVTAVWFGGGSAGDVVDSLLLDLLAAHETSLMPHADDITYMAILAIFAVILLLSLFSFLGSVRGMRTKPYKISIFFMLQWLLCTASLLLPGSDATFYSLLAIPCCVIIPNLFIRYSGTASVLLYILFIFSLLLRNLLLFVG